MQWGEKMILAIECFIACVLFTLMILPSLYKEPIKHIMSYPTEIRKRVENLPQYKDVIQKKEKKHLTVKIMAVFMLAIIFAVVAYFSGAKSFSKAYIHVFTLSFVVNIYDMIVLDIGLFVTVKKLEYLVQKIWIKNIEIHGII